MKSKAKEYFEVLSKDIKVANTVFCAVIFIFGFLAFLLTRSLPALFISLAFFLFGLSHVDEYFDVNRRFIGRGFAIRVLAYFLVITALIASFKL
jgi:hypothetical protein